MTSEGASGPRAPSDRISGGAAIAADIAAFLYAVAFIIRVIAGGAPEPGFALASALLTSTDPAILQSRLAAIP